MRKHSASRWWPASFVFRGRTSNAKGEGTAVPGAMLWLLALFFLQAAALPELQGSCAGFLTNDEVDVFFDSLHAEFPSVTTPRITLGLSILNRPVSAVCIGACLHDADSTASSAPATLLTGMHHSREVSAGHAALLTVC
jgi:hypothetical protein